MKKFVYIIVISIFFSILAYSVVSVSKNECEQGGGTWVVPSYKEKPDPREPTDPFCQCGVYDRGRLTQKWNGSACVNLTREDFCIRSNGQWNGFECICENGEWIEDVGCQFITFNKSIITLLVTFIILIVILIFSTVYLYKKLRGTK